MPKSSLKLIIFFYVLLHFQTPRSWAAESCQQFLIRRASEHGVTSRTLFIAIQSWMNEKFARYPSQISMEFSRAKALLVEPENRALKVISFGSGPDIFTPLMSFPMAREIHLVDLLSGWGEGSGRVLWEILQRCRAIHPSAHVKVANLGFVAFAPRGFVRTLMSALETQTIQPKAPTGGFAEFKFWESIYPKAVNFRQNGWALPLEISVEWEQEDLGRVSKSIFVHPLDFQNPIMMKQFNRKFLGKDKLAGLVVTGIVFPSSITKYVKKLAPGASAVLEVYSDSKFQRETIKQLRALPNFEVKLAHLETFIRWREEKPIQQKLFVVKKLPTSILR